MRQPPLCRRHHVDLHHGDWTITITDGEVHVARPAWADPPPQRATRPARQPDPADHGTSLPNSHRHRRRHRRRHRHRPPDQARTVHPA
ncbi:hypothetical protein ACXC9Q_32840 [Kribbella sp. CWNU-51]